MCLNGTSYLLLMIYLQNKKSALFSFDNKFKCDKIYLGEKYVRLITT